MICYRFWAPDSAESAEGRCDSFVIHGHHENLRSVFREQIKKTSTVRHDGPKLWGNPTKMQTSLVVVRPFVRPWGTTSHAKLRVELKVRYFCCFQEVIMDCVLVMWIIANEACKSQNWWKQWVFSSIHLYEWKLFLLKSTKDMYRNLTLWG